MLNLLKTFRCGARRRGSALLIVLGFLSFMVISGVSFAIYMRTERQASSNYRHAVNGRHLLNAGLARAMEEIDSELRLRDNDERKFPDWPGRVRVSAATEDEDNDRDARVLSIESLSFLPPFLINDVRRYAVRQGSDSVYEGAKWRSLEGSVFGRYAYVCVNVSDMLDVNQCRAQLRDVSTNRVSLGHLFETDTQRTDFDQDAEDDGHYFSLQDFYATRYERAKNEVSSPFHMYIKNGNFQPFENSDLLNQVFIADSIAKPEPVKKDACNIWLNPPIDPTLLKIRKPDPGQLSGAVENTFWDALRKAKPGAMPNEQVVAALLKDYIDEDNVPSMLNVPCLERVPMVSQIVLDNDIFCPKITTATKQVGNPARDVTVYSVQLFGMPTAETTISAPLYVELVWPFKHTELRPDTASFDIELDAYLKLHRTHSDMKTTSFPDAGSCIKLKHTRTSIQKFWRTAFTSENDCFYKMDLEVEAPRADVVYDIVDSDGAFSADFAEGQDFSVSFIIFARIRNNAGDYVDCAPQGPPIFPEASTFADTPKLYFQTDKRTAKAVGMNMQPIPYLWTGLDVADPRFNHNAANWVPNSETKETFVGVNPSTKKLLQPPLEGRDADLFMFVSDMGALHSPGELGFIVRPDNFRDPSSGPSRDFRDAGLEPIEKDFMFRPLRTYDHGDGYKRDDIYNHFYAMRADGTLPGARVNPLSDMPEVLEAALWDTPLDYWIASTNNGLSAAQRKNLTFTRHARYFSTTTSTDSNWKSFRDAWADGLDKVMKESKNPNTVWSKTLSDYYGDAQWLAWYSEDVARKNIFGINVPNALHEIDRKMLYSFSLDSFSDRQQLFLYFIRAEATVPSFGGGTEVGLQSLAGGRAVALVWRDPYPRGFVKDNDDDNGNDAMDKDEDWYPDGGYKDPWRQYPGHGSTSRYQGYHDTRVLFFKQLGQ